MCTNNNMDSECQAPFSLIFLTIKIDALSFSIKSEAEKPIPYSIHIPLTHTPHNTLFVLYDSMLQYRVPCTEYYYRY